MNKAFGEGVYLVKQKRQQNSQDKNKSNRNSQGEDFLKKENNNSSRQNAKKKSYQICAATANDEFYIKKAMFDNRIAYQKHPGTDKSKTEREKFNAIFWEKIDYREKTSRERHKDKFNLIPFLKGTCHIL